MSAPGHSYGERKFKRTPAGDRERQDKGHLVRVCACVCVIDYIDNTLVRLCVCGDREGCFSNKTLLEHLSIMRK